MQYDVPLQEDVAGNSATGAGQFHFSRNGTFVYSIGKSSHGTWIVNWLDSACIRSRKVINI
jgi:hypothetical protein